MDTTLPKEQNTIGAGIGRVRRCLNGGGNSRQKRGGEIFSLTTILLSSARHPLAPTCVVLWAIFLMPESGIVPQTCLDPHWWGQCWTGHLTTEGKPSMPKSGRSHSRGVRGGKALRAFVRRGPGGEQSGTAGGRRGAGPGWLAIATQPRREAGLLHYTVTDARSRSVPAAWMKSQSAD